VSYPVEDPDPLETTRRRPSHFRTKKRGERTTKLVKPSKREVQAQRADRVVQRRPTRQEHWSEVINQAPALPDPLLQRPMPPPAPLPSERAGYEASTPAWLDDRHRRKRVEDLLGAVGLAILVAAMLVAMWLQMRQP
jgi:hypothetical protein